MTCLAFQECCLLCAAVTDAYQLLVDVDKSVVNVLIRGGGWSSVSLGIWHEGLVQKLKVRGMSGCSKGPGLIHGTSPNTGAICLVLVDLRSKTTQHWFYFFGEVIESKLSPVCLKARAGEDAVSRVRTSLTG